MDWIDTLFTPVDAYCERLAPGWLGEPFNLFSNIVPFIACLPALMAWRRSTSRDSSALAIIVSGALLAFASALHHALAERVTLILDVGAVLMLIASLIHAVVVRFLGQSPQWALQVIIGFLFVDRLVAAALDDDALNGSAIYLPAALFISALLIAVIRRRVPGLPLVLGATTLFLLAALARTVDTSLCSSLPIGTHWLWHACNGLALYCAARAAIIAGDATLARSGPASHLPLG